MNNDRKTFLNGIAVLLIGSRFYTIISGGKNSHKGVAVIVAVSRRTAACILIDALDNSIHLRLYGSVCNRIFQLLDGHVLFLQIILAFLQRVFLGLDQVRIFQTLILVLYLGQFLIHRIDLFLRRLDIRSQTIQLDLGIHQVLFCFRSIIRKKILSGFYLISLYHIDLFDLFIAGGLDLPGLLWFNDTTEALIHTTHFRI